MNNNTINLLKDLHIEKVELLPYHRLGENKRIALGQSDEEKASFVPTNEEMEQALKIFLDKGIPAVYTKIM